MPFGYENDPLAVWYLVCSPPRSLNDHFLFARKTAATATISSTKRGWLAGYHPGARLM